MRIRYGYRIELVCAHDMPLITLLDVHPSRRHDLTTPDEMKLTALADPSIGIAMTQDLDAFGNIRRRMVAPAGGIRLESEGIVHDSGEPDIVNPSAREVSPSRLPDAALVYLLGSRYCETDRLSQMAWDLFGATPPGWARVQAICDHVHRRIEFGYPHAFAMRTAAQALEEGRGVCRDFAHAAVALCRCMNIPARYCTGYLGDIGIPPVDAPMDFSAWFEVYLGGRWHTFDARHNTPRIGRVLIARGRDASDVAISNTFGPNLLHSFEVWTDETDDPTLSPRAGS